MSVYRKPFAYAQRQAARVEWQPQPSWVFDATSATWEWRAYVASVTVGIPCTTAAWAWQGYNATVTVSGAIDVAATLAAWEWQTYRANIASSVEIVCATAEWNWTGQAATLEATRFSSSVTDIRARVARSSMNETAAHPDFRASVARNTFLARVA